MFDGCRQQPYREADTARPLNENGRAKHHAERAVAQRPQLLVVRTAALFGPWDPNNFVAQGLDALRRGEPWLAIGDQTVSPTYVPDLVHASLDLLIDDERGLWHVANAGSMRWHDFACRATKVAGLPPHGVRHIASAAAGQLALAVRPAVSALTSNLGLLALSLNSALERYIRVVTQGMQEATSEAVFGALPEVFAAKSGSSDPRGSVAPGQKPPKAPRSRLNGAVGASLL